ncbi:MAG: ATP-binding protein [Candidatus Azobacteroides sp.]|nr:ATP-binding protein [Candidatus Azobacteroides sp.]
MLNNRKLPIGIQDFEDLRINNYLYVDKTTFIYQLVTSGKPFFLGRPRRFGKSLFLSTLKAYFLGKKELFEGLAIARWEKEWIEYPVFHIDLNVGIYSDLNSLYQTLNYNLQIIEEKWGQAPSDENPATRFSWLIRKACEQSGQKVVVLIDEYDKPLLGTMGDLDANENIRNVLKGFYGILKSADAYLRFVFLTGVTKFAQVSIFSDLNQLQDISMDERFAEICGISGQELMDDFEPEISLLAQKTEKTYQETLVELKRRYDGYHFVKRSAGMYNPFSLLNTFAKNDFANYWFQTGTPTFLVKMLKDENFDIPDLENNVHVSPEEIVGYRAEWNNPIPILYQSGYLTIRDYDNLFDEYILGFPNEEVKYGFLNELLPAYVPLWKSNQHFAASRFVKALMKGNVDGFMTNLRAFYATIPYDMTGNRDERYYQFVFYLLFSLMGQFVQTEVKSARGRADAVVKTSDTIYVFEFKMSDNGTAEEALKQIDDKGYLIPYTAEGRKIVKIGTEFSEEKRGLSRWIVAE